MSSDQKFSARAAYQAAYSVARIEAAGVTHPSYAPAVQQFVWKLAFLCHPQACNAAAATVVHVHQHDVLNRAEGWVKVLGKFYFPYRHSVTRPASRLPGTSPESQRSQAAFVNRTVSEVTAGFFKSASFKRIEAEADEIRAILGL